VVKDSVHILEGQEMFLISPVSSFNMVKSIKERTVSINNYTKIEKSK
jgi:hypothetical protein